MIEALIEHALDRGVATAVVPPVTSPTTRVAADALVELPEGGARANTPAPR